MKVKDNDYLDGNRRSDFICMHECVFHKTLSFSEFDNTGEMA